MVFINYANIISKNSQGHKSKEKSHKDIGGQNNGENSDDDVPASVDGFFQRFGQTKVEDNQHKEYPSKAKMMWNANVKIIRMSLKQQCRLG